MCIIFEKSTCSKADSNHSVITKEIIKCHLSLSCQWKVLKATGKYLEQFLLLKSYFCLGHPSSQRWDRKCFFLKSVTGSYVVLNPICVADQISIFGQISFLFKTLVFFFSSIEPNSRFSEVISIHRLLGHSQVYQRISVNTTAFLVLLRINQPSTSVNSQFVSRLKDSQYVSYNSNDSIWVIGTIGVIDLQAGSWPVNPPNCLFLIDGAT